MFSAKKLLALCKKTEDLNKLYHVARKKVNFYDLDTHEQVTADEINAVKFELFLHNVLPMIDDKKFGVMKVVREDEFAPVKNANG